MAGGREAEAVDEFYEEVVRLVERAEYSLDLSNLGSFPEAVMARLCVALAANKTITTLKLGESNLGSTSEAVMARLSDALTASTAITALSLRSNNLGSSPEAVMARLCGALAKNATITTLNLGSNDLGSASEAAMARLSDALAANTTITTLDLGSNKLGSAPEAVMAQLCDALAANTSIATLKFWHNDLGSTSEAVMARLGNALAANTTITDLDLSNNDLGSAPEAVMARVCDALAASTTITNLNLYANDLGSVPEAVMARLGDALAANTTIMDLDLRSNDLGSAPEVALARLCDTLAASSAIINFNGNRLEFSSNPSAGCLLELSRENAAAPREAEQRARCLLFCCVRLQEEMLARLDSAPVPAGAALLPVRERVSLGALPLHVVHPAVVGSAELHFPQRLVVAQEMPGSTMRQVLADRAALRLFSAEESRKLRLDLVSRHSITARKRGKPRRQVIRKFRQPAALHSRIAVQEKLPGECDELDSRDFAAQQQAGSKRAGPASGDNSASEDKDNGEELPEDSALTKTSSPGAPAASSIGGDEYEDEDGDGDTDMQASQGDRTTSI